MLLLVTMSNCHQVKQASIESIYEGSDSVETIIDKYDEKETSPDSSVLLDEGDADENYEQKLFDKYAEEQESDDGMPSNKKVIKKDNCKLMAQAVLKKEKGFNDDEIQAYIKLNFNRIWKEKFGKNKELDDGQAHQLMEQLL